MYGISKCLNDEIKKIAESSIFLKYILMKHCVMVVMILSFTITRTCFAVIKYLSGDYTFNNVYLLLKILQIKLESLDKHDPINAAPILPIILLLY